MEGYRDTCPAEVEDLKKETNGLIFRLMQGLEVQFKEEVEVRSQYFISHSCYQMTACAAARLFPLCLKPEPSLL